MRGLAIAALAFIVGVTVGYVFRGERTRRAPRADTAVERESPARRIAIADEPAAAGSISGMVRMADGSPIPGVVITATPQDGRGRDAMHASSVADGSYTLDRLAEGTYRMAAVSDGVVFTANPDTPARPGDRVDFEGRRTVRVEVDVVVADSGPAERARIHAITRHDWGPRSTVYRWSRAQPWIDLPYGAYELMAELTNGLFHRSPAEFVAVHEGRAPPRLRLQVRVRPALRMRVEVAPALRGVPVQVWLLRLRRASRPGPQEVAARGTRQHDMSGGTTFVWKDLLPGSYCVGAGYLGGTYWPQVTKLVEVTEGVAELAVALPEPPKSEMLRVRLLDPAGNSLYRAKWAITVENKDGAGSNSGVNSLRRSDGDHLVPLQPGRASGTSKWVVTATNPTWGTLTHKFDPAKTDILVMQYEGVVRVQGFVRGYAGSGHEGRVRFRWEKVGAEPDMWFAEGGGVIEDDGKLRMPPQEEGERVLALYVISAGEFWSRIATKKFDLVKGTQSVSIELPPLHELRVVWPGRELAELSLLRDAGGEPLEDGMWRATVGKDGVAVFRGLPAGEYRLSQPGADDLSIEVPRTREIRMPK